MISPDNSEVFFFFKFAACPPQCKSTPLSDFCRRLFRYGLGPLSFLWVSSAFILRDPLKVTCCSEMWISLQCEQYYCLNKQLVCSQSNANYWAGTSKLMFKFLHRSHSSTHRMTGTLQSANFILNCGYIALLLPYYPYNPQMGVWLYFWYLTVVNYKAFIDSIYHMLFSKKLTMFCSVWIFLKHF